MNDLSEYVGFNYIPMFISQENNSNEIIKALLQTNMIAIDIPDLNDDAHKCLIEAILKTK